MTRNSGRLPTARRSLRTCATVSAVIAAAATALHLPGAAHAKSPRTQPAHVTHRIATFRMPAPGGGVVQFNREDYRHLGGMSTLASEAAHDQVVVLGGWDGRLVRTLHRFNPRLIVLLYQHALFARGDDTSGFNFCTTAAQVARGNWYLRSSSGQPIIGGKVAGAIGVDPGIAAYERACAQHAAALARRFGFNGVLFDGIDARLSYDFSTWIPRYGSVSAYQGAMTRFLATLRTALHRGGVQLWGNIGGATATPGLWQRWAALMDGAMEESWTDGGLGLAQQVPDFPAKLADAAWSERNHRYVIEHSWNTGEAANTYGLAAMLLVAGGYTSYSTSGDGYSDGESLSFPEFATAQRLGAPTGRDTQLRHGLRIRRFQHGMVVVNPTFATVTTALGGTYSGSGLSHASRATLGPTSGLILLAG